MQMNTRSSRGPIHEMRRIASSEGVRALWKGVGPAMARAATLTASQLATYNESKQAFIKYAPPESQYMLTLLLHIVKPKYHFRDSKDAYDSTNGHG